MDSLVGKLKNFVPIDKRFGYVEDVDTAYHEPSFTRIWNNNNDKILFVYFKDFGKHRDRGIGKDQIEIHNYAKISIAQ